MGHFSDELSAYFARTGISQQEFAKRSGIERTRLSRLVSGHVAANSKLLDVILEKGVPDHEEQERVRLVQAYLKDKLSPGALLQVTNRDGFIQFPEPPAFSPECQAALKSLSRREGKNKAQQRAIEAIIVQLSILFERFKG